MRNSVDDSLLQGSDDQSQAARSLREIDLCRPLGLNGCSLESKTVVTRSAGFPLPSFLFFSRKFQPTDFLVPLRARARDTIRDVRTGDKGVPGAFKYLFHSPVC